MNIFNVVNVSHYLLEENLKKDAICVDATCGNGNDTLFISQHMIGKGFIYAFDIQKEACINTSSLLRRNNIVNAKVICDSHENVEKYVTTPIDCAVFNLGYLPHSKSKVSTQPKTTIKALQTVLGLLSKGGFIVICAYIAHDGGMREYSKTLKICTELDNSQYQTLLFDQPNAKKIAPKVIFIKKKVDF